MDEDLKEKAKAICKQRFLNWKIVLKALGSKLSYTEYIEYRIRIEMYRELFGESLVEEELKWAEESKCLN